MDCARRFQTSLVIPIVITAFLLLPSLADPTSVRAQSGGSYDLTWSTIDCGGYTFSTGGSYLLGGTAGQQDAGVLSGGTYILASGFWIGGAEQRRVYLPLVLRACFES